MGNASSQSSLLHSSSHPLAAYYTPYNRTLIALTKKGIELFDVTTGVRKAKIVTSRTASNVVSCFVEGEDVLLVGDDEGRLKSYKVE
jgi:hypothetical protein